MTHLCEFHPALFETHLSGIITIVSQVMTNSEFDEDTRSIAAEMIVALAAAYPALVRRLDDVKTTFFPAIFQMIADVELKDDSELQEWSEKRELDDISRTDPHGVGKQILGRFAADIGEKTTISATSDLIKEAITNEDWKIRQAGYFFLAGIAETCRSTFKSNLDEIMRMACSGVMDDHPRVKYAGLSCLAVIISVHAPHSQKTYHADIVPQLIQVMSSQDLVKVRTQGVAAMVNFVRDLIV